MRSAPDLHQPSLHRARHREICDGSTCCSSRVRGRRFAAPGCARPRIPQLAVCGKLACCRKGSVMPKVEMISRKRLFDDFFKVEEAHLKFERYDGNMSEVV